MGDLIAILFILVTGAMAAGLAWAMFYAATRRGRSSDDYDKETPPPGWGINWQWVICTHCDIGWWKRPDDDNGCPHCDNGRRDYDGNPPGPARADT